MNKPAAIPVPAARTLAEQKVEFTAEGSPPPGKVATALPVAAPAPVRAKPKRQRPPKRPKS